MFRQFGYEYVGYADTEWIRRILTSDNPPAEPGYKSVNVPKGPEFNNVTYGTGVAHINGFKCLSATVPTPDPKFTARTVLLPGFGDEGKRHYEEIGKMKGKIEMNYDFSYGSPEQRLKDKSGKGFLHKMWRYSKAS
jgi:proline-rich tail region repeat protein